MKKFNILLLIVLMSFVFACGKSTSSSTDTTTDEESTVIEILSIVPASTSEISAHIKNISTDPTTIDSYTVRAMRNDSTDPVAQITVTLEDLTLEVGAKTVINSDLGSGVSSHNDYDYLRFTFNVTLNHSESTVYNSLSLDY
jgi:hypothetical protein